MPLKLIEHVLLCLMRSLIEDEAKSFLKNILLAAHDSALVILFSGYPCKGRNQGVCLSLIAIGWCPLERFSEAANSYARPLYVFACAMPITESSTSALQDEEKMPIK